MKSSGRVTSKVAGARQEMTRSPYELTAILTPLLKLNLDIRSKLLSNKLVCVGGSDKEVTSANQTWTDFKRHRKQPQTLHISI